jgi:hypothetical protein
MVEDFAALGHLRRLRQGFGTDRMGYSEAEVENGWKAGIGTSLKD